MITCRRLTKRLQPTGRGAASSTLELFGPRPAAEAHVVSWHQKKELRDVEGDRNHVHVA